MNIENIAFNQGMADWLRFKRSCPPYWRGTDVEKSWKRGHNYAARWNR